MGTIARHNHQDSKKSLTNEGKRKSTSIRPMMDLSNDPFFVKKTEDAKKLLDKYGTPKK